MDRLRVGVVGAGQVAQLCHLMPLAMTGTAKIAALADLRPQLAKLVAAHHGIPKVYSDHKALLEGADLDALVVVTNRAATGPIVLDAVSAGLPVLSEKPLTHSVAQARTLVRRTDQKGGFLGVAYMKRCDPGFLAARSMLRELFESGAWGALRRVDAWSLAGATCRPNEGHLMTDEPRPVGIETWPSRPEWLHERFESDYAHFLNVHVHALNWLADLLGDLELVNATWDKQTDYRIELVGADSPVSLHCGDGSDGPWQEGARVEFDQGTITIEFPPPFDKNSSVRVAVDTPRQEGFLEDYQHGWSFDQQAAQFASAVRNGQEPAVSGKEALRDLETVEAIWRRLTKDQRLQPDRNRSKERR